MSKSYSHEEAAERREQILNEGREQYDHVRIVPINPGDPASAVKVLARRHDNHVIEDEV